MPKNDQPRKLKIQPKYFPRVWEDAVFPEIRLAGKWLQDLGFVCGQFVNIRLQDNTITISLLPPAEVQPPAPETKREKDSSFPSELQNANGYEMFNERADYLRAWMENEKTAKRIRRIGKDHFSLEAIRKARLNTGQPGSQKPQEPAADQKIIQLHQEVNQVAAADNQIIPLHPEPFEAADGCNYDTIA